MIDTIRRKLRIQKPSTGRTLWLVPALVALVVIVAACEKVPMPESDETPPELTWVVTDHGTGERREFAAGDEPVVAEVTSNAVVTLIAHDDQGVHKLRLDGPAIGYTCVQGDVGRRVGPGLIAPGEEHVFGSDSDGMVLTEVFTLENVYFHFDCGDGWELASVRAELYGYGENFFEGTAESMLILEMAP